MAWPLREVAQLSSDCCPDQLYEKPVPKKPKDQVAQRQRIVSGNGGRQSFVPFLGPVLMSEYANPKHGKNHIFSL